MNNKKNTKNQIFVAVVPAYNEEKSIRRTLDSLVTQSLPLDGIVIVNNSSKDRTGDIVCEYQDKYDNIYLVLESKKGTGFACNTGFNFAIEELNADIVNRTDADTVPANNWNEEIEKYFRTHPTKQIVSGPSHAFKDEFYRNGDQILWPLMQWLYRNGSILTTWSKVTLRFAIGHNMAIRADAFKTVGGFSNSSIDKADEDFELSRKIYNYFGLSAMDYDPNIEVWTSMRRIRQLGYPKLVIYYWKPTTPPSQKARIKMTRGNIDKR